MKKFILPISIFFIIIFGVGYFSYKYSKDFYVGKYSDRSYQGEEQIIKNNPKTLEIIKQEMRNAEKKLEENAQDKIALIALASKLYNLEEFALSEEILLKALQVDDKNSLTYSNLAEVYRSQKKKDKVIEVYKKWVEKVPTSSEAYTKLSREYYYAGNKEEAKKVLQGGLDKVDEKSLIQLFINKIEKGEDI